VSRYPQAEFLLSTASAAQFPVDIGAEVAFAGRSNAGKSTAINVIVGRKGLARTSKMPGRTRLVNFFQLAEGRRLVDLPGYGYATASAAERDSWAPMIDALAQRESLHGLFVLVDSRRGLLPGDETLLEWAASADCPVQVLLSKVDKLGRAELSKTLAQTKAQLAERATLQPFSAISGQGLEEARGQMDRWLRSNSDQGR
jgi:GTP-binding protein